MRFSIVTASIAGCWSQATVFWSALMREPPRDRTQPLKVEAPIGTAQP